MSDEEDLYALVRAAEAARAAEQLAGRSVTEVVTASRRRHDALATATLSACGGSISCKKGCAWCCNFRVAARADEVLLLVDHLRATRDEAGVAAVLAAAQAHAARFARMTSERRMRTNALCPLLEDGACTVYEVRPQTCRMFHAIDVEGCQASVEDPERDDIPSAMVPELVEVSSGHDEGLVDALSALGRDVEVYELNAALVEALTDEAPRERYEAGEVAFLRASFDC